MSSPTILDNKGQELPEWATKRCRDCGELFLPGFGAVWSSLQPDRWTHGGLKGCRRQADYLSENPDALALCAKLTHQALVEVAETCSRFISEADDENWNKEVAEAIFAVYEIVEAKFVGGHTELL